MERPDWTLSKEAQKRKRISDAFLAKFPNPSDDFVLACLADENFAHRSTWHADSRLHAFNEGRRSVWLSIEHLLRLRREDLEALASQMESFRRE